MPKIQARDILWRTQKFRCIALVKHWRDLISHCPASLLHLMKKTKISNICWLFGYPCITPLCVIWKATWINLETVTYIDYSRYTLKNAYDGKSTYKRYF